MKFVTNVEITPGAAVGEINLTITRQEVRTDDEGRVLGPGREEVTTQTILLNHAWQHNAS
jgi:hypothetical protein